MDIARILDLLQWPAMAVSLLAAWLVASRHERSRGIGFWVFLGSNVLWIAWGVATQAWALVVLQLGLGIMNVRGVVKNDAAEGGDRSDAGRKGSRA